MKKPSRVKWRKVHKGNLKGTPTRGTTVEFGDFGLQAMEPERITSRQLAAARVAMTRQMNRGGKVWIRVFPDKPVTKKPAEVRMGKGKGNPEVWVAPVRPGRVLFEVEGVGEETARQAFERASAKLPFKTKFIERL